MEIELNEVKDEVPAGLIKNPVREIEVTSVRELKEGRKYRIYAKDCELSTRVSTNSDFQMRRQRMHFTPILN